MDQATVKKVLFGSKDPDPEDDQPLPIVVNAPPHKAQDRYTIGAKLGKGSGGETYTCTDNITGDLFACKKVEKYGLGEQNHHRTEREFTIMQKVSHQNIITLTEGFQDEEAFYFVMELCSGGTLGAQMEAVGRYPETAAANIIRQIMEAIKYCHQNGIIHHDLKPDNIVLIDNTPTSKLKLIDFGLSMMIQPGEILYEQHYCNPSYRAPELFTKSAYGPKIDIWSAGVILYELLHGTRPFHYDVNCKPGREYIALGMAVCKGVKDFNWKETSPHISDDAIDILKKMLARESVRINAEEVLAHPWMENAIDGPTS